MINAAVVLRDEFFLWLSKKVSPSQLSEYCIVCVDVENFCLQENILEKKLFETTDFITIENLIEVIGSNKFYKKFRANYGHNFNKVSVALKYYRDFLKSKAGSQSTDFTSKVSNDKKSEKIFENRKENTATVKSESVAEATERILTNKKAFKEWLKVKYVSESTALKYLNLADTINKMLKDRGIITKDLFLIAGSEQLRKVKNQLFGSLSFANFNFMTAFDDLIAFCKENSETKKFVTSTVAPKIQAEQKEETVKSTTKAEDIEVKNAVVEKSEKAIIANREAFRTWLKSRYTSQTTLFICFDMMDEINKILQTEGISASNALLITDSQKLVKIKEILPNTISFKVLNNRRKNDLLTALNNLIEFRQDESDEEKFPSVESIGEKIALTRENFKTWLKSRYTNKMTALICFEIIDEINKMLKTEKIEVENLFLISDTKNLSNTKNIFRRTNLFTKLNEKQRNNILKAFDDLIAFCEETSATKKIPAPYVKSETQAEKITTTAEIPIPAVKSEIQAEKDLSKTDKYTKILSKYFGDDGYKLGFVIHRNKFKKYFSDEYGENPADSAEQIEETLKEIGTQRDNRIFPKQNDTLIDDIVNDIVSAFEAGASAVFVEAVYEKYKKPLADELKIYNAADCAPAILKKADKKFFHYYAPYFSPRIQKADPVKDIKNLMQESHQPLSYEGIFKSLWYIPRSKIEFLIKNQIPAVVSVASEMFFYAPNLPTDETELQKISSLLQAEIDFHGYITDVKLLELIKSKYPIIAVNLEGFNAYAVRKCLSYLLAGKFSFNGSVISALGSQLNLSEVFAEFAREHETLTLEELKNFAKELDTPYIYWSPVLNETVRISQNNFVRKDLIHFNARLIDNCLEEMYPQNYTPLKEITLFMNLPNIGYAWSSYLLESYLHSFSRKFRLVHSSFSETGVYGAMVRADCSITDYDSLITDALSNSDSLTESKALQFLVDQGYQQRKAYKNIGDVIKKAKLIKENRRKF